MRSPVGIKNRLDIAVQCTSIAEIRINCRNQSFTIRVPGVCQANSEIAVFKPRDNLSPFSK